MNTEVNTTHVLFNESEQLFLLSDLYLVMGYRVLAYRMDYDLACKFIKEVQEMELDYAISFEKLQLRMVMFNVKRLWG